MDEGRATAELKKQSFAFGFPLRPYQQKAIHREKPSEFAEIDVLLPPLPEQRRIVAKIDSLTDKSRRARDHLDRLISTVSPPKRPALAS